MSIIAVLLLELKRREAEKFQRHLSRVMLSSDSSGGYSSSLLAFTSSDFFFLFLEFEHKY